MAAPLLHDAGTFVPGIDPEDAVQILGPGADRMRWLAMRRLGLGGSDVSALVGLSRWTSPIELWEDKVARLPLVDEQSEAAEMGTLLEPVVRDRFARVHDLRVRACGMLRSQRWPWMLANPDGLCSDGRGYEGKTCSPWQAHEWGTESDPLVPDHAELQAQWCMAVTGWPGWWVACLIGGQRNVYRLVERDDGLIGQLVEIGRAFWHNHVLAEVPPPVDGSDACTRLLTERFPLADLDTTVEIDPEERDEIAVLREKAIAAEKAAKADYDAVKNRIRTVMGTAETLMCGDDQIATWKHTNRFSDRKFRDARPDLAAEYTRQVDATDTERLAADHPTIYRRFCSRELRFSN